MKLTLAFALFVLALPAFAQTNLDQASGWSGCSVCAEDNVTETFKMTQHISSPSMDGASAKFSIGGTNPYGLALWHKFLGYHDTAKTAKLDMYMYSSAFNKSNGIEFAASQAVGGKWYKWSVQFSFNKGYVSVWDSANHRWAATSMPARIPSNYKWHHYTLYFRKANGKAYFDKFIVDGQTYYINKSFYPQSTSNHGISTHFQLNMNRYADDYAVFVDKFNLTIQ
jgi:hypothetical protein